MIVIKRLCFSISVSSSMQCFKVICDLDVLKLFARINHSKYSTKEKTNCFFRNFDFDLFYNPGLSMLGDGKILGALRGRHMQAIMVYRLVQL